MIHQATTEAHLLSCRDVLLELRPHISPDAFLPAIQNTLKDQRKLIFIEENGRAVAALVFEWGFNLYRGRYIYIDDLSTLPEARGKGYASQLLDWVFTYARQNNFDQIHLDSAANESRWDAHRLYLNKGYHVTSLHFAMKLKHDAKAH
jgi:GNAT superfamily N-acetyltransferase